MKISALGRNSKLSLELAPCTGEDPRAYTGWLKPKAVKPKACCFHATANRASIKLW